MPTPRHSVDNTVPLRAADSSADSALDLPDSVQNHRRRQLPLLNHWNPVIQEHAIPSISTVITLRDCHLQLTIAYHRGTCVCRDSGPWLRGGPQSSDTTQKAPSGCYIESILRGCIGRHRGCAYVEIANLLPLLNIAGYTRGGASRSTVDTSSICANGSPTVATPKTHTFGCRWWTLVIVAAIEVPSGRDRVDKYGPVERSSKFWTSRLSCGRQPALQHNSEGQIDPGIGLSTAGEPLSDPQPTHRGRCQHPNAPLPAPRVRSTANTSLTTPCQSE